MISVNIKANAIHVQGHSGYAEAGKDIVCAGVSVLLQVLIQSMESLTEDKIEYNLTAGDSVIVWENLSEGGKLLVDSFFIGVCMIAEAYPDYVMIGPEDAARP